MPFQGNPNAGQPDPALLNLLFQQKQQREEMAYKQQQDALAAQRQAQLDAAEEARKSELHQAKMLDLRVKTANALQSQEKQIGADQKTADYAKEQVAQQNPFISTPGQQTPMGVEYGALPDQSIQNAYTQKQFNEQVQAPIDIRQAMLASNMAQVPGFEGYGDSLPMQGRLAQATQDRVAQEEEQKKIDAEARAEEKAVAASRRSRSNSIALAEKRAELAAAAPTEMAVATDRKIRGLSRQANAEKDPAKRADLQADLRAATVARDADMLKFQPGEAIKFRETTLARAEEYRRKHLAVNMLKAIEQRPDVLSFRPGATQFIQNVVGTTADILTFIAPTVNAVMQDPGISQASKDRVEKMFVYHINPDTGERLEEARLEEAATKWILSMGVNESGRQSQKQLDEWARLTNFSDALVSVPVAIDRLRATQNFIQRDLDYVARPELVGRGIQFEQDGRILGDPSFSWGVSQPLTYEDVMGSGTPQAVDAVTGAPVGSPNSPKNVRDPIQEAIDRRRQNGPQN